MSLPLRTGLLICLAWLGNGCGHSIDPGDDAGKASPVKAFKIVAPRTALEMEEGELFTFRPRVALQGGAEADLAFRVGRGELPDGCVLDASTGELRWTPAETQGPGSYQLGFVCTPSDNPDAAEEYELTLKVLETNTVPSFEAPSELTVAAGAILEQRLTIVDTDFPANRLHLELTSGPDGAVVDAVGKLVYWEVPADWQQPQVEFTFACRDDGAPAQKATHTLLVTVTDIVKAVPVVAREPKTTDRLTEVAVELPPLPRPGEPVEATPLDFKLDPPAAAGDTRLSLMLPDGLRGLLKMRYLDDLDHRLAILLTDPFEADEVQGNLQDGIVATCELTGDGFRWTWAMTKDLTARGYQNNIRHGVLVVESKQGGPPRLVALQKSIDVPAPTIAQLLGDEELQARLVRRDRVKKVVPLEGFECTADNGNWQVDLDSHIDGFSLFLVNQELTRRVNARVPQGGMQFSEFGFRILPIPTEITIGLAAKPSPAETYQKMRGARKSLIRKQSDARRWTQKLATANAQLSSARRMKAKTPTQVAAKNTKINQATRAITQAQTRLNKLSVEIPADRNLVATMEAEWKAIVAQLKPVQDCTVSGELWRRIGDVRVPVLRLVPVDVDIAEN